MSIGTKSVLFGAHCFFIHPWFVALAWWRLYGLPLDARLWVAFFVHDLGYIGKPNMDGPEGETHPELGARIMGFLFGSVWSEFTLLHSRFYARAKGKQHSKLCAADKLATALTPRWLYLMLVNATGEISEYMGMAGEGKYQRDESKMWTLKQSGRFNQASWHQTMTDFMKQWAEANK
jgi:hypothetical protein